MTVRMNMRNFMCGMDAKDLRNARSLAVKERDTERVDYIDEWVHELFADARYYPCWERVADCSNDSFWTYRVTWADIKGYVGVDYFDNCVEAKLCMLCAMDEVKSGRRDYAGISACDDSLTWYSCDSYGG